MQATGENPYVHGPLPLASSPPCSLLLHDLPPQPPLQPAPASLTSTTVAGTLLWSTSLRYSTSSSASSTRPAAAPSPSAPRTHAPTVCLHMATRPHGALCSALSLGYRLGCDTEHGASRFTRAQQPTIHERVLWQMTTAQIPTRTDRLWLNGAASGAHPAWSAVLGAD